MKLIFVFFGWIFFFSKFEQFRCVIVNLGLRVNKIFFKRIACLRGVFFKFFFLGVCKCVCDVYERNGLFRWFRVRRCFRREDVNFFGNFVSIFRFFCFSCFRLDSSVQSFCKEDKCFFISGLNQRYQLRFGQVRRYLIWLFYRCEIVFEN